MECRMECGMECGKCIAMQLNITSTSSHVMHCLAWDETGY